MLYGKEHTKIYDEKRVLGVGQTLTETVNQKLDDRYNYKVRLRGEVGIPYEHRTEDKYPIYFRKIDDSLCFDGEYTLEFSLFNQVRERSCYNMVFADVKVGESYDFSVRYKAKGIKDNFKVSAEIYYGKRRTRYYYEKPDTTVVLDLIDSDEYTEFNKKIVFTEQVDFIMIKISAIAFEGCASVYAPTLSLGGQNLIDEFEYAPDKVGGQKWIGEGFSLTERPHFTVRVNGTQIFSGNKTDRLHRLAGAEFLITEPLDPKTNVFEITYDEVNKIEYHVEEFQLIKVPKHTEITGVQSCQVLGVPFGVLCYFEDDGCVSVNADGLDYLGKGYSKNGYCVLKFVPTKTGNITITVSDGKVQRSANITVSDKAQDGVITGSGDFIYVNQNFDDFIEYLSWYLTENIGDMLTLRSCYRWGATADADDEFWTDAVGFLKDLGLYYVLMIDGRELNGVNANPKKEILLSPYFLGEQTHERDGAFTYWQQECDEHHATFYHLLSRKLERCGIYGKYSPVYDKAGNPRIYYAGDDVENMKDAYDKLVFNLKRTAADGATRHTGVTPLFSAFFDAGYKWLGYESMYGSHEIIFGALRGMSNSIGQQSFGSHLALQWSTVPCDVKGHALRYRLALYSSYMCGASHVNTEEGLWNIENPFEGFDRFSYACTIHREEQKKFNRFVKTHTRKGKIRKSIAMMVGKYDGMDCFSTGMVYGQSGEEWKYAAPEDSWDMLKAFYPQAKIGAIYHFVQKGGMDGLRQKDKDFLKAWPHLYGNEVLPEKSLGFYSATPYGMIDIISHDAKNLDDYKFIFMTGWNTCSDEQLIRLCAFMDNGGKVMMTKAHLYNSVDRREVLFGGAKVIESEWADKFLSYQEKGNLILFDMDGFPSQIKDEYLSALNTAGKEYGCQLIEDVDHVCFAEYERNDGSSVIYYTSIRWWDEIDASFTLKLGGAKHKIIYSELALKLIAVSPDKTKAVLISDADVFSIDNNGALIKGFGDVTITVFNNEKRSSYTTCVDGEKYIEF